MCLSCSICLLEATFVRSLVGWFEHNTSNGIEKRRQCIIGSNQQCMPCDLIMNTPLTKIEMMNVVRKITRCESFCCYLSFWNSNFPTRYVRANICVRVCLFPSSSSLVWQYL